MVSTIKFSQFASANVNDSSNQLAGLGSGLNVKKPVVVEWTTAGRPTVPFDGLLGYNTDLKQYEYWNLSALAWDQLADFTTLASHASGKGASLIGLQDQSHVTSKTVQDLANAQFVVNVNNGSLQNAQSLGSLTTGIVKNTTSTGALSISTPLTQIDNLSLAQGDILYYNGSSWAVLPPSTAGFVLQTQGPAANPQWVFDVGTGTVTQIDTGTGLTGGPITTTGTISLASIADGDLLANTSGGAAAPIPTTLTALIDYAIGNTQGDILYRNASGWVVLAPGTSGQVLTTGGAAANPSWATNGAGTVTSIATNNGITGGTITSSGTIELASIADQRILANISGGSTFPSANTLSDIIDHCIGNTQGDILYRNASGWVVLAPGTSGEYLQTQGAAANPIWAPGDGAGTVTSIATNNGITGGTITSSGTIGLASVADGSLLANISGGSTFPSANTLTAIIDHVLGSTQGNVLYRNSTAWVVLAPGTNGQFLTSGGAAADVSWTTSSSGPAAATQADQETGTSTTTYVSPGRQQFHASAAKAWATGTYSAGTPAATASYNITSYTDAGTGDLVANFTVSFSAGNQCAVAGHNAFGLGNSIINIVNTGNLEMLIYNDSAVLADNLWSFAAYGDQ